MQEAQHHAGEGHFTVSWILHPDFHTIYQGYHILYQDSLLPKPHWNSSLVRHPFRNNHISPYSPSTVGADVAFHHFPSWKSWQDDEKMNGPR